MASCAGAEMSLEELEERYSPSELPRLRAEVEELRERLVSTALRGRKQLRRRVTVGRTPLGECLRQLAEAQGQWEAAVREEGALQGEEGQVTLLNLLEKGLALMERVQALREGPPKRRRSSKRKKKGARGAQGSGEEDHLHQEGVPSRRTEVLPGEVQEKQPPGPAPQEETPLQEEGRREGAGGELEGEGGEEDDPEEEEGDQERDTEGGDTHKGEEDSSGNSGREDPDRDEVKDKGSDEDKDKSMNCDDLLEWMEELEQEMDVPQDPSQEVVDHLREEAVHFKDWYVDIRLDKAWILKDKVLYLWSALWLKPFEAVTALQEALSQCSAVEAAALKAESDSLESFLQAVQSKDTLAELTDFYCSLDALLKVGLPCGDPLKEADVIKQEMDSWFSSLLHVLLKESQEKTNALQEKVDAVQGIPPEQTVDLKAKMGTLQKQMGLLCKVLLKEVMSLLAMAYKLYCKLESRPTKEVNTIWKKACDLAVTLKAHLKDVPQEEGRLLWGKVADLEATLHDIPVEKLVALEEKVCTCIKKVDVLQNKIWKPLDEELEFLKEKLHSSQKEQGEVQEELMELEDNLAELTVYETYPLKGTVNALEKKMNALRKKMNVPQKAVAPLEVSKEAMQVDKTGFSELLNAQDAVWHSIFLLLSSLGIGVYSSSSGLKKTWHMEAYQEERCSLVQNFAKKISPDNDSEAAKKILEAYAVQIESEVYSLADSKTEYHQLIAEKLNAMNKKLDETSRSPSPIHGIRRNEQPTLQGPCIQPPGVPSVAATTGEVQPPNLPSCAPHSAAQKRSPSELEVADDPRKALQIQDPTSLNRPPRWDPPQSEGTTCARSSGESLAHCEPALAEGEDSEPPHKKQKMNPTSGTQEPSLTQELFAVLQKHFLQRMERVSDIMNRVHGTAFKDTEEAKALAAALQKAQAHFKSFFEDA